MVPATTIPVRITARDHRIIRNYNSGILRNRCNLRKIKLSNNASHTSLPSLFLSNTRSLANKIDELCGTVSSLSPDIVVITETWLSPNVNNSAINLNGFSTFRHDRQDGRRGGGVCVYVNDQLPVVHLKELSYPEVESLWLLIKPRRLPRGFNSIILAAIYHPPQSDDRALLTHLIESLDSMLTSYPASAIIIAGDFNQFRHSQLCNSFSLKQVVKQATRGSNILDKIFTNASKFYNVPEILPPVGFSDHYSVLIKPLKQCANSRSTRMVRDTRSSNRKLVFEALSSINWSPLYRMASCNDKFHYFSFIVNSIVDQYLPMRRLKSDSSDKPWVTTEIKRLISKRQAAWNSGNNTMFLFYRNKVNMLCKRARSRFYNNNVADCFESNPHKWWSSMKNIAGLGAAKNVSTVLYNGQSYSGSALANLFNDRFVAVGSTLPSFSWSPIAVDDVPSDFFISIDEVEKALISVKSHSAAGPDEISPWFLRENSASLSHPLASIFNASIQEGNIPLLWKSANVSPVPKSSPALDIDSDFRPISLTPIVSKILESFLYSWLPRSVSGQIDNLQFGALKRSNSTMALLYMFHKWYEAMDTPGTCLRICPLDFSKAFDRIDFNILLQKLINMGIHPVLINWIANFLTDRRQRTRIGSDYSCWRPLNGGVPQGTKLGPLLFLIMVNDLKVSDDSVKFVDDTTLREIITSAQSSTSVLQPQIDECSSWVARNNMKLNPTKTKEIRVCFSTYDVEALPPLTIDGCTISVVSHAKLLGLIISEDLKWVLHVDFICKKAAKRLYALRLLKRSSIPSSKLVRVFNTCIRPILEYACVVWHHSLPKYLSDQIERIQRRALRIIFPDCCYDTAMARAGVVPLFIRRETICKRLFERMRTDESHKLHSLVPSNRDTEYSLRGGNNKLSIPRCRTNRYANSFIIASSKAFNISKT